MIAASLVISIMAILISLLTLWKTHFAPFSPLFIAGRLSLRIYPIRAEDIRWFMFSLDVPISVANEGAQPGVVHRLQLRLHFPKIPIANNCEFMPINFEVGIESANQIDKNRFDWISRIVLGSWMPFIVLPKTTVTKHYVFETRWERPVIQEVVLCTLQAQDESGKWRDAGPKWEFHLTGEAWTELVDRGTSISCDPDPKVPIQDCEPADLHKYTGSMDPLPENGFGLPASYLDFPKEG